MFILILGEGNFSYTVSFLLLNKAEEFKPQCIFATSYDDFNSCVKKYGSDFETNIDWLNQKNVNILFGIDAKILSHCLLIKNGVVHKFGKIIFNFPHIGRKAGIQKNR